MEYVSVRVFIVVLLLSSTMDCGSSVVRLVPNLTVSKDGRGDYTTISEALKAMPQSYPGRYTIYVRRGIYAENVVVGPNMVNLTIYGDGYHVTIVTGDRYLMNGTTLGYTATFAVQAYGFMAQYIGFRNTAGPIKYQAVALSVEADHAVFLSCLMEGYQDTLYAISGKQFYRNCRITGTIDFIFGNAKAVFQKCDIVVRKPLKGQQTVVTAQGKANLNDMSGFVLQGCIFRADQLLEPEKKLVDNYLGRPWKDYSTTVIMESYIGDFISPKGWLEWANDTQSLARLSTLFYTEFNNFGPGSNTAGRVHWPGYKIIQRNEALKFTVELFLQGRTWLPSLNVPVQFGLFN